MCTIMHGPNELEDAMEGLIRVFAHYAHRDADRFTLSWRELITIFDEQFDALMKKRKHTKLPSEFLNLDKNRDGEVDFGEFVSLATKLTMCTHPYFGFSEPILVKGTMSDCR